MPTSSFVGVPDKTPDLASIVNQLGKPIALNVRVSPISASLALTEYKYSVSSVAQTGAEDVIRGTSFTLVTVIVPFTGSILLLPSVKLNVIPSEPEKLAAGLNDKLASEAVTSVNDPLSVNVALSLSYLTTALPLAVPASKPDVLFARITVRVTSSFSSSVT